MTFSDNLIFRLEVAFTKYTINYKYNKKEIIFLSINTNSKGLELCLDSIKALLHLLIAYNN
jgi:hypothetical protein